MSIRQIPVQPLTQEAFAPYGTVIDLPEKPENYELRSSDRFDFSPSSAPISAIPASSRSGYPPSISVPTGRSTWSVTTTHRS